ncbi:DUF4882 family protein [Acinetobacter bereziniae]|uniref:DUF4882 family protein n=1 Tax=Acinetobacter bereziniae TaxID=106648 RepID=UPI00124FA900|nr:DUF4882 family protein [Acinetobacter bereziniae]MDA3441743.1 DUF4882 domain-containing protein [Acinetobacter bereziniae]
MKKLTIAILTGLMSASGWSACTYDFDVTAAEFNKVNNNPYLELFPNRTNQKLSINLVVGNPPPPKTWYIYTGASSAFTLDNSKGDKVVTSNGIFAFEYKLKVPINNLSGGALGFFPAGSLSKLQNGEQFDTTFFYHNSLSNNLFSLSMGYGPNAKIKTFSPINTTDGYQRIGIYINQNSKQAGLIINGVNYGYLYNLTDKIQNIGFVFSAAFQNIQSSDANQEVSFEVVTDASKITQTYPTGTKDICGNAL